MFFFIPKTLCSKRPIVFVLPFRPLFLMPLFFSHHSFGGGGGLSIILSFVGTYQSDPLLGPFFFLFIFVPYKPFLLIFLHVFFFCWLMTLTSWAMFPSSLSLLTILLLRWLLWVLLSNCCAFSPLSNF